MSLAQGLALARLLEGTGEDWLYGGEPLTDEMLERLDVSAVYDDPFLHVLLSPGSWVTLDRAGETVAHQTATRAEVMTVQLRASPWWASMRRLLKERGVNPATSVLGDGFDDDVVEGAAGEELSIDTGVLLTDAGAVIAWRRRYDDERPELDEIIEWDDITEGWRAGEWRERVEAALALQADGLRRLRPSRLT